jgi:hypothetical protein
MMPMSDPAITSCKGQESQAAKERTMPGNLRRRLDRLDLELARVPACEALVSINGAEDILVELRELGLDLVAVSASR